MIRLAVAALSIFTLIACDSDPIGPDPTGSGGSTSAATTSVATTSASSSSSGAGGAAPATFVGGSRLKVRKLTAEDGSTQQLGFHDTMRDEDCSFRRAIDGKMRCLPEAPISSETYADAACSQPVLVETCSTQPPYFLHPTSNVCPDQVQYAVEEVSGFATGTYYVKTPAGACNPTPITANVSVWTTTAGVSPSEFVRADESLEP